MAGQLANKKRVLILGGGFGGVTAAQRLQHHFKRDASVEITLVNRDNYFVFVPLLASAASGSIETLHILNPIRRMIPGITFRAEEVMEIDLQRRIVTTASPITGREVRLPYDHLVLDLGNTINLASLPGLAQHAKTMKSLGDALHLRNHVISMLEAADVETDPRIRLEADVLNMGRAPDNHIVMNDRRVSCRHAVLKREGTNYVLEDLGTPNGTFVNDERIQRHVLASGDAIRLGQSVFTYRVPVAEQR